MEVSASALPLVKHLINTQNIHFGQSVLTIPAMKGSCPWYALQNLHIRTEPYPWHANVNTAFSNIKYKYSHPCNKFQQL